MELRRLLLIKSTILQSIREFMYKEGFVESIYPGITNASGSCESVGNVFQLKTDKFLTLSQTAQLLMEADLIKSDLSRIYCIGRSFRKDVVDDGRHLLDFSLMEYEALDTNLNWLLDFNEQLINRLCEDIMRSNLLTREELKKVYDICHYKKIHRLPYKEAIFMLNLPWGTDLKREHEAALTSEFGIVQVTHYPESIKFFNMARTRGSYSEEDIANISNPLMTADCVDVLLPYSGETIGGSAREYNYKLLVNKLNSSPMLQQLKALKEEHDSKPDDIVNAFETYLTLFKENVIKRSGAGFGCSRFLQFLLGSKDIIPF